MVDFNYLDYTIRMLKKQKEEFKRLMYSAMNSNMEIPELRIGLRYIERGIVTMENNRKKLEFEKKQIEKEEQIEKDKHTNGRGHDRWRQSDRNNLQSNRSPVLHPNR